MTELLTRADGTSFDPADMNHLGDCLAGCTHSVYIGVPKFYALVRAGLCTWCEEPMDQVDRFNPGSVHSFTTHPCCDLDGAP